MSRMDDYRRMVEETLDKALTPTGEPYDLLVEAMRYAALDAGKRIRPILTMEFCRVQGGRVEDALPFACALELIHCYSLVHDDLPCMDDDDLRRGKPSCHKQFGEANALLAGDALLTKAFELASHAPICQQNPQAALRCIAVLSKLAGVCGMIGGQVLDLAMEGDTLSVTPEALSQMHLLKTGALIQAACTMGTILAGKDDDAVARAAEYGQKVGLAFQLVDDLLDVTGDEQTLGKPIGSDAAQDKTTFITLFGLEQTEKMAKQYTAQALTIASSYPNADFLCELTQKLLVRRS